MPPAAKSGTRLAPTTVHPWIALAAGVSVSLLLFVFIRDAVENVARLRFEREANDAHAAIEDRLRFYADGLYGLRALFATQESVSRVQFHRFVESLDLTHRYPGFDAVNYAAYVPAKDKNAFEAAVRRDASLDPKGYPRFAIKPPGDRPDYYVIVYLEPMAGFEFAFGLDLAANPSISAGPQTLRAMQHHARDSGTLTASGLPIRVKTATGQYMGLAMRLAVYRNGMPTETTEQRRAAYVGSVGAGLKVDTFIKSALSEKILRYMRTMVYDVGAAKDRPDSSPSETKRLLFDSDKPVLGSAEPFVDDNPAASDERSTFSHVAPIEIA